MHTFFKHQFEPRVVTKARKRAEEHAKLAEAYAEVDRRDGSVCCVTGRYTVAGSPDRRNRREHHHLTGRNVAPERVADPTNIITVCAEAHALIEAGFIVVEGTDARKPIVFHWASWVKANQKPFRIQAKRQRTGAA